MRFRMVALVATAAAAVATSTACTAGDSPDVVDEWGGWHITSIIEDAKAAGASADQIAILEEAEETGEVRFQVYSDAVDLALRCIREAGGRAEDGGTYDDEGVLKRFYSVEGETEESDPVEFLPGMTVHRCIAEHSIWVEVAYQTQPSSVEEREAFWEQYRDILVECLRAEGIELAGDEPILEIRGIAAMAYYEDGTTDVNCLAESGYMGGTDSLMGTQPL